MRHDEEEEEEEDMMVLMQYEEACSPTRSPGSGVPSSGTNTAWPFVLVVKLHLFLHFKVFLPLQ